MFAADLTGDPCEVFGHPDFAAAADGGDADPMLPRGRMQPSCWWRACSSGVAPGIGPGSPNPPGLE